MKKRIGFMVLLAVATVMTAKVSRAAAPEDGGAGVVLASLQGDSEKNGGGVTAGKGEDGDRYFFDLLTRRSRYGTGFFPEHFRQTSLDREHELRLDYFHGGHTGRHEQELEGEVEWAVRDLTLTVEAEWETEREKEGGTWHREQGWETVKLKAHHPLYQFVSADDFLDYTLVGKVSVGVPLSGSLRHDSYEIYPLLGQMLRLGGHFTTQTWTGVNFSAGGADRGARELRYGALFGWNTEVAVPGVRAITPLLELDGQSGLSGDEQVHRLYGVAGARFDLTPAGPIQPRFGLGYLFPIDTGARRELSWGVQSSLIFEF